MELFIILEELRLLVLVKWIRCFKQRRLHAAANRGKNHMIEDLLGGEG